MDENSAFRYEDCSLAGIREELRKRGAKTSGRKADCIERLRAYDRNSNFGVLDDDESSYKMTLPGLENYKDINTGAKVPKLLEEAVNQFLRPFEKELSLKSGNRLCKAKFIKHIRWAQDGEKTFFGGSCRAEMKKHVLYKVDIQVDVSGNIRQAQCECAAGMGPSAHCKHTMAILFCLMQFFRSGKLETEVTCTDKLQTFHRSKKFTGSPILMSNLMFGKMPKQPVNKPSRLRFDPRPLSYRNQVSYNDYCMSTVVNFTCSAPPKAKSMSLMQLVKPANPFAVVNDHDYCALSGPDYMLKHLKVTEITPSECKEIEIQTRGQSLNPRWLDERLHRITSSNFGRICKATDRTDMDNLARSYIVPSKAKSASLQYGHTFEKVAMGLYSSTSGNIVHPCGIFVNPECPYIASSPDGIVDSALLVEIKCPYTARDRPITHVTVPYLCLDPNDGHLTLSPKHDYYYQIQGQLYCAKRKYCDFVVYTKKEIKVMRIQRRDGFIKEMMAKLNAFFQDYFKPALLNKYIYRDYDKFNFSAK